MPLHSCNDIANSTGWFVLPPFKVDVITVTTSHYQGLKCASPLSVSAIVPQTLFQHVACGLLVTALIQSHTPICQADIHGKRTPIVEHLPIMAKALTVGCSIIVDALSDNTGICPLRYSHAPHFEPSRNDQVYSLQNLAPDVLTIMRLRLKHVLDYLERSPKASGALLARLDADTCQWVRTAKDVDAFAGAGAGKGREGGGMSVGGEPLRSTHGVLLCLARALPPDSRYKVREWLVLGT